MPSMENKILITKYQFEQLINLPVVKKHYTYYRQEFTDIKEGEVISTCEKEWLKWQGIEFVVGYDE